MLTLDINSWAIQLGVMRVRVIGDEDLPKEELKEDGNVPFRFIGTSHSIESVFALLSYHINYLKVFIYYLLMKTF